MKLTSKKLILKYLPLDKWQELLDWHQVNMEKQTVSKHLSQYLHTPAQF